MQGQSYIVPNRSVKEAKMGLRNCVFVRPDEDLVAKYAWLASTDRDAKMGAASTTNRRKLIIDGVHTVTDVLTLDTDYVDILGLSGNYRDAKITRAGGTGSVVRPTVEQTCNDVRLIGFTIENTGTNTSYDYGFNINVTAGTNADSYYKNMYFKTNVTGLWVGGSYPVYGTSDIYGLWEWCKATNYAWRPAVNKTLGATMLHCDADDYSYGGDRPGSTISGIIRWCKAKYGGFGGCDQYGCNISAGAILEYNESGDNSYAMGREIAGTLRFNKGGVNCFAGTQPWTGTCYGSIANTAYLEGNVAAGGNSFAMGHANCVQKGVLINNKIAQPSRQLGAINKSFAGPSTITDESATASVTTALSGDHNDITYTAVRPGAWGNKIWIEYYCFVATSPSVSVESRNNYTGRTNYLNCPDDSIVIWIRRANSARTANQVVAAVNADPVASRYVIATIAEGDGSGNIATMAPIQLTGGVNAPYFKGNCPDIPIACTVNTTIYPFDNGATYTNKGATGAVLLSLPAAVAGLDLEYHFEVAAAYQLQIDPNGTEHIYVNGVDQGAGVYIYSSTVGQKITLRCLVAGRWDA